MICDTMIHRPINVQTVQKIFDQNAQAVGCDGKGCNRWFHPSCLVNVNLDAIENWFCTDCRSYLETSIKWGSMTGEYEIGAILNEIYKEVIGWQNNCFMVPRGKVGKDLLDEITRLLNL